MRQRLSALFARQSFLIRITPLLALLALDPFGLTSNTSRLSEEITQRLLSPFYGRDAQPETGRFTADNGTTSWDTAIGQREITVVLLNDEYLRITGEHWPLERPSLQMLIDNLLEFRPRALFIDLLFDMRREDNQQLLATLEQLAGATGVPVMIAGPRPASDPGLNGEPRNRYPGLDFAAVTWRGEPNRYPLHVATVDGAAQTPAWKLFHIHSPQAALAMEKSAKTPMVVRWGSDPSELMRSITNAHDCRFRRNGVLYGLGDTTGYLFTGMFQGLRSDQAIDAGQRRLCPYSTTLHPHLLGQQGALQNELFNYLLHDRVVLLGANISGIGDWVTTPTHGQLPGVYLHAMALDNLIELEQDYWRDSGRTGSAVVTREVIMSHFARSKSEPLSVMSGLLREGRRVFKGSVDGDSCAQGSRPVGAGYCPPAGDCSQHRGALPAASGTAPLCQAGAATNQADAV